MQLIWDWAEVRAKLALPCVQQFGYVSVCFRVEKKTAFLFTEFGWNFSIIVLSTYLEKK